ncbi:MAG TPA: dTDP-4-amino-4,6-dideoxygalactose transaminase [Saprospiraceae bacterium]|nr:dTDP-4-amino-4,6-dideoxygalactose transaminase [Saprospiraceae bacterium]
MQKNMIRKHLPLYRPSAEENLREALQASNSGSGPIFFNKVKNWFARNYTSDRAFLTHSCTGALELAGLLAGLEPDDEVILPSYTFSSTANAFLLRGCRLRFADCLPSRPNTDLEYILPLVNDRTKIIVAMHYAGIAVDMDPIMDFAAKHGLVVIEDAAQAVGARYKGRFLGTCSDMGTLSFHDTKMISCGEGGALLLNRAVLETRAEILFEKGTNRMSFQRGEVARYEWLDLGSSFGMSDLQAALLYSQLEDLDVFLEKRLRLSAVYSEQLSELVEAGMIRLMDVPDYASHNGSEYYITLNEALNRPKLMHYLQDRRIETAAHFLALHNSPFFKNRDRQQLRNASFFESNLLRLPMHAGLERGDVLYVAEQIRNFFKQI